MIDNDVSPDPWFRFSEYIDGCVDKLYLIFQTFGYEWAEHNRPPSRGELQQKLVELVRTCISEYDGQQTNIQSGRILVSIDNEGFLQVSFPMQEIYMDGSDMHKILYP